MNWKFLLALMASLAVAEQEIHQVIESDNQPLEIPQVLVAKLTEPKKCPSPPKYEGCWVKTARDVKPRKVPCGTMPMRFLEEGAPEGPAHKRWRECEEGRCSYDDETGTGMCLAIWCGRRPHWGE